MTALTAARFTPGNPKLIKFSAIELPVTAGETLFQGGRACVDTTTGLVRKAAVSATVVPIGNFTDSSPGVTISGQVAHITLDREVTARWWANSTAGDAIVAADLLKTVFLVDDQTCAKTNGTNTRSAAGRVWAVDSVKGVLVESRP